MPEDEHKGVKWWVKYVVIPLVIALIGAGGYWIQQRSHNGGETPVTLTIQSNLPPTMIPLVKLVRDRNGARRAFNTGAMLPRPIVLPTSLLPARSRESRTPPETRYIVVGDLQPTDDKTNTGAGGGGLRQRPE